MTDEIGQERTSVFNTATMLGGPDSRSYLGYSVNQFFGNSRKQAHIVRLVWGGSLSLAPGTAPVTGATARAVGVGLATSVITATLRSVAGASTLTVGATVLQTIAIMPALPPRHSREGFSEWPTQHPFRQ